jgi:lipid-A-disaccharide synthase
MLLKRPMVVAYKVAPLSYRLLRHLVKIDRFSLPNILAGDDLVEEYIQQAVQPQALARAVLTLIEDDARRARLVERFTELHEVLRCNAAQRAAQAVLEVIGHER